MKLAIAIFCFLITSCATYLKGDLSSTKIAQSSGQKIVFEQIGENSSSGVGGTVGPYFTMFTLGVIPFYSTNNADVDLIVKKNNIIVLKEQLDSRFHTTYGWLAINAAEKKNSDDLMSWHEGASLEHQMVQTLDERVVRFLTFKLHH